MSLYIPDRFLSTPSARRATRWRRPWAQSLLYFYPRPLRGGRHTEPLPLRWAYQISIHALCEEGDRVCVASGSSPDISIHALCEEGDLCEAEQFAQCDKFLSTPSARRATPSVDAGGRGEKYFYPRPLRGGRRGSLYALRSASYFYPRPLRGGRQQKQRQNLYFQTNYTTFCTNLEEP